VICISRVICPCFDIVHRNWGCWRRSDDNSSNFFLRKVELETDHQGISSLKQDGKLITDPIPKANVMNDQFKSVVWIQV
jgi:hypothetical protein